MTATTSAPATGPRQALVTGATSGIGRATAVRLARDGWEVVVHGRNPQRGAEVVEEIGAQGAELVSWQPTSATSKQCEV